MLRNPESWPRQVADEVRSGSPAGAPLTSPSRGVRGPASAAVPEAPRMRAQGSGLSPNWVPRSLAANGFAGTSPGLFVQLCDGLRPCVCPGAGLSYGPVQSDSPRFLSCHCSSPCACPRLDPAAARCGGLGRGAGAGPGLFLSDGPGVHESPKYLPWLRSCPRPEMTRGQQPTTSFTCRWPNSRSGGKQLTCAHAHLPLDGPARSHLALGRQGAVVVPAEETGVRGRGVRGGSC